MNKQITQEQINRAAWAACDTFRGVMDPANYKDYILVMLFLKYISDIWKHDVAEYQKRFNNDDSLIDCYLKKERFFLPEGTSFYDLLAKRNEANIGELINEALETIEEANRSKLADVFRNIDFNSESSLGKTKERNSRLKSLLEDFNKPALDLNPSRVKEDIIGECYIYLISNFASSAGKKAGEFYTPAQVSRLLAKLAAPKPGDIICDPACGSGSLLIYAAEEVNNYNTKLSDQEENHSETKKVKKDNYALFGQEMNGSTWALARMNMFLHAKDSTRIDWGDTLNNPTLLENGELMKFDVVVANPPFSLDKWGYENAANDEYKRFKRGVPPKTKGDYAFISHMIETTKPLKGRTAVVVPHGVLFRGSSEGRIRQHLIEENLLDAVIGLPANLFSSTGIPVAILVFDRSRESGGKNEKRQDVLFIDASKFFCAGKGQNYLEEEHIAKIVDTYRERKSVDKYAYLADIEEIRKNKFNLNIPRYVDTFEEEEEIDIAELQKEIRQIESELIEIRTKMDAYLKELGIDV